MPMDLNSANEAVDQTAGMPAAKLLNKVFIVGIILLVIVGAFLGNKLLDQVDAANQRATDANTERDKAIQAQIECYNTRYERAEKSAEWMQQQHSNNNGQ